MLPLAQITPKSLMIFGEIENITEYKKVMSSAQDHTTDQEDHHLYQILKAVEKSLPYKNVYHIDPIKDEAYTTQKTFFDHISRPIQIGSCSLAFYSSKIVAYRQLIGWLNNKDRILVTASNNGIITSSGKNYPYPLTPRDMQEFKSSIENDELRSLMSLKLEPLSNTHLQSHLRFFDDLNTLLKDLLAESNLAEEPHQKFEEAKALFFKWNFELLQPAFKGYFSRELLATLLDKQKALTYLSKAVEAARLKCAFPLKQTIFAGAVASVSPLNNSPIATAVLRKDWSGYPGSDPQIQSRFLYTFDSVLTPSGKKEGTSFAAPAIAAIIAKLAGENSLPEVLVTQIVLETATPVLIDDSACIYRFKTIDKGFTSPYSWQQINSRSIDIPQEITLSNRAISRERFFKLIAESRSTWGQGILNENNARIACLKARIAF